MKAAKKARRPAVTAKRSTPKPAPSQHVALSLVMQYENPGQLTVPNQLNLGNDGRLYLTRSEEGQSPKDKLGKLQSISVKESVAWFRLGHECNMSLTKGEKFSDWLKSIEQGLA
jgi:hypothetical protein